MQVDAGVVLGLKTLAALLSQLWQRQAKGEMGNICILNRLPFWEGVYGKGL